MKKAILFLIITIACVSITSAQTYKLFKIDLGIGDAIMPGNSGLLLSAEAAFNIHDNISVGLKLEQTFGSMKWTNSELLAGDYYFIKKFDFRPYAGGGIGYYTTELSGGGCDPGPTIAMSSIKNTADKIGGMIRTGFEAQHFRFGIEYNFVPTTHTSYANTEGGLTTKQETDYKNNYFSISFGIYIGGGKRKSRS